MLANVINFVTNHAMLYPHHQTSVSCEPCYVVFIFARGLQAVNHVGRRISQVMIVGSSFSFYPRGSDSFPFRRGIIFASSFSSK